MVGFSGEGAGSAAWAPGSDLLAYAADCLVVVEDLKTRKCRWFSPYNTKTGFSCNSTESSSSAVRPPAVQLLQCWVVQLCHQAPPAGSGTGRMAAASCTCTPDPPGHLTVHSAASASANCAAQAPIPQHTSRFVCHLRRWLSNHSAAVSCVVLAPACGVAASGQRAGGGRAGDICLWDLARAECTHVLTEHIHGVQVRLDCQSAAGTPTVCLHTSNPAYLDVPVPPT